MLKPSSLANWRAIALALIAAMTMACSSAATSSGQARLIVGSAADLQFALEEMAPLFLRETGVKLDLSFGSSGSLATQIENGAPIDVFVSADEDYVARLQQKGLIIDDTRQVYAYGRLALVSSRSVGMEIKSPQDLLRPGLKHVAIANPDIAPYGRAARQALERVGIWEQIRPKLVYGENVRQTLQFVQTGDAEAGIVSLSIAQVPEVTYAPVDERLYDPLKQTLAVVLGTHQETAARQFIAFMTGPEGTSILSKYGFELPGGR